MAWKAFRAGESACRQYASCAGAFASSGEVSRVGALACSGDASCAGAVACSVYASCAGALPYSGQLTALGHYFTACSPSCCHTSMLETYYKGCLALGWGLLWGSVLHKGPACSVHVALIASHWGSPYDGALHHPVGCAHYIFTRIYHIAGPLLESWLAAEVVLALGPARGRACVQALPSAGVSLRGGGCWRGIHKFAGPLLESWLAAEVVLALGPARERALHASLALSGCLIALRRVFGVACVNCRCAGAVTPGHQPGYRGCQG